MKKIITLTLLSLLINIGTTLAITLPTEPLISDETKKQVQETAKPALEATFESRKALILTGVNIVLKALTETKNQINNSVVLNSQQKEELLTIVTQTESTLYNYKKSVEEAKTSEELTQANKNLIQYLKDNKEKIRATVAKVVMIGVEGTMQAAEEYLKAAADVSSALKLCGSNTTTLDEYIKKGNTQLSELEKVYQEIMADGKVSQDEASKVKEASRLAAQLSTTLAEITSEILLISTSCPVAESYLNTLDSIASKL